MDQRSLIAVLFLATGLIVNVKTRPQAADPDIMQPDPDKKPEEVYKFFIYFETTAKPNPAKPVPTIPDYPLGFPPISEFICNTTHHEYPADWIDDKGVGVRCTMPEPAPAPAPAPLPPP